MPLTVNVQLDRTSNATPWGFRMRGGKEFRCPITIERVNLGSLAAQCGLQVGDRIASISGQTTDDLPHKEVQQKIVNSGNTLSLTLIRGGVTSIQAPNAQPAAPQSYGHPQSYNNQQVTQQANTAPKPFHATQSLSNQTAKMTIGSNLTQSSGKSSASTNLSNDNNSHVNLPRFNARNLPTINNAPSTSLATLTNTPTSTLVQSNDRAKITITSPEPNEVKSSTQSRTFRILQDLVDSGQDITGRLSPKNSRSRSPSPSRKTYNCPGGLYQSNNNNSTSNTPVPPMKMPTYNVVHDSAPPSEKIMNAAPPATFTPRNLASPKSLVSARPLTAPKSGGTSWLPKKPTGARNMKVGRSGEAMNMQQSAGGRVPICEACHITIRGPFILALEKSWCPEHFICSNPQCNGSLVDSGFIEEAGNLFCVDDYKKHFAPPCAKCQQPIVGDMCSALDQRYHPECFLCTECSQPIGAGTFHLDQGLPYCDKGLLYDESCEVVNALKETFHTGCFVCISCNQSIGTGQFHIEEGHVYCEKDWGSLFQTKCNGCQFPIEPGDRWVEALNQNWHSECFNCSTCQINLEGESFFAKANRPYCKKHAAQF